MVARCKLRCSKLGKEIRRRSPSRNKRSITALCATADPASASTRKKWKARKRHDTASRLINVQGLEPRRRVAVLVDQAVNASIQRGGSTHSGTVPPIVAP